MTLKATHTDAQFNDMEVVAWQNDTSEEMRFLDGIWGPHQVGAGCWCVREELGAGYPINVPDDEFKERFTAINHG